MSADPAPLPAPEPAEPPPPAADAPEPPEPDEDYVAPDQFRFEEDAKQRIVGDSYERQYFSNNAVGGPSMHGNNNTQNIYTDPRHRPPTFGRPPAIEQLVDCYAPTATDGDLQDLLGKRHTVCLAGEIGSGRFSTACHALLARFAPDQIAEILPPLGQPVADSIQEIEKLDPEQGYLLRIHDEKAAPIMRRLDEVVGAARSTLILIRDVAAGSASLSDAELIHVRPAPSEVFRRHLQRLAPDGCAPYLPLADDGSPLPDRPREVVALVDDVLKLEVDDARALMLARDAHHRREIAKNILEVRGAEGPAGRRRLRQHRRAFRIAYASLLDQPIGRVFDSTGTLLAELDKHSGWDDLGRTALEHSVENLLGPELREMWTADNPFGLVRLKPELVEPIFGVAWHEFDHTRPALLAWVTAMTTGDETSRQAAIRVAATLALVDFDEVVKSILDPWSASPRIAARWTAAQIATILASAHQLNHRVLSMVHSWVWDGTSSRRRDTAAVAYAGGLRQVDVRWNLADLERIAQDAVQLRKWTVAEAVRQLLEPGLAGLIVASLADWVQRDASIERRVSRHAARALLRLVQTPAAYHWGSPPLLLATLAESEVSTEDLALLWGVALLGASTRRPALQALLDWLRYADRSADLREPVGRLVRRIAASPRARREMRRCLVRPDTPAWITTVIEEWRR